MTMLLVTATSILTEPNTLTVLLEHINLFQSQSKWQYKANIWEEQPPYPWPYTTLYLSLTNWAYFAPFVPVSYA